MKKTLIFALAALLAANLFAQRGNLKVFSFTDELQTMIEEYYTPTHPNVYTDYALTPVDQFAKKLDSLFASNNGAPDVFALEDSFVRKYVEQGDKLLLDLTDVYNSVKDKMMKYPVEVGTYNGRVYALSWQATPGAFFYRRSLAKKYLGTDDPAKIQKMLCNWDSFLETARKLKANSSGKCVMVSSTGDLFMPFKGARNSPWVVNGKLFVDSAMIDYMEMCKTMNYEGLEGRQGQWTYGWFDGMKDELKDENGWAVEIFGYFLPTWGLHYVLKPNGGNTSGDWAMCEGPAPYRWGGTWLAAYKNTKNPGLAKEFIKYLATDDGFLEKWAKDTGDLVSNNKVVNKIKNSYKDKFLGGQNHYSQFAQMANNVNGKLTQGTDQAIEMFWGEAVGAYLSGEMSKDDAISYFKERVANELGF